MGPSLRLPHVGELAGRVSKPCEPPAWEELGAFMCACSTFGHQWRMQVSKGVFGHFDAENAVSEC